MARRLLRHEVLGEIGPEAALELAEIESSDGAALYELRVHGDAGWLRRHAARGEAEAHFDGFIAGVRRGFICGVVRRASDV